MGERGSPSGKFGNLSNLKMEIQSTQVNYLVNRRKADDVKLTEASIEPN